MSILSGQCGTYIYIFFEKSEDAIGVADGLLLM